MRYTCLILKKTNRPMFDIKITYSSCDGKFPLEFSTIRNHITCFLFKNHIYV